MVKLGSLMKASNGADKGALGVSLLKAMPELIPSLKVTKNRIKLKGTVQADLALEVVTPPGRKKWLFFEVKANPVAGLVRESIRQLKARLPKRPPAYAMLGSNFIGPRMREVCREEGVGYLDLAGNCYLRLDDFYLEKEVEKNPFPRLGRPASLFTPISSRILRAFLEEPKREWTVLELSRTTRVSLGQTSNVCRRLLEEKYVAKAQGRIQIAEPGKLLDDWREEYVGTKSTSLAYYSLERDPAQIMARVAATASPRRWRYAVTSFAAASVIAPFVRGVGNVVWYVQYAAAIDPWVKALDLRPVEAGPNVTLLVPYDEGVFYRTQTVNGLTLVGNIQMYLDLYNNPARGKEQAEFLRQQKIGF